MKKDRPHSSVIRIIGLGNGMRGDDAVGLLAARRLRQEVGDRVEVIEAEMAGVDILDLMEGARMVILIDAARSGQAPGHRSIDSMPRPGPIGAQIFPRSSHAFGPIDALELARAMGVLPATIIVYGVEAGNTETGQLLSAPVAKALDEVVAAVVQECEARHA